MKAWGKVCFSLAEIKIDFPYSWIKPFWLERCWSNPWCNTRLEIGLHSIWDKYLIHVKSENNANISMFLKKASNLIECCHSFYEMRTKGSFCHCCLGITDVLWSHRGFYCAAYQSNNNCISRMWGLDSCNITTGHISIHYRSILPFGSSRSNSS